MTRRNLLTALAVCSLLSPAALEARDLGTPKARMEAIAPLVQARVAGRELQPLLARRAAQEGVSEARLMLWLDLFMSHGHTGLLTLSPASAHEMARNEEGTWKMSGRLMDGRMSAQDAYQFNQIIELGPGYSKVRNLSLEAGILEDALRQGLPGDGSFRLGASGVILHQEVTGEQYGLEPGEVGVLQTFTGELYGIGYPGIDNNLVQSKVEALWVKQGDTYRTSYLTHEFRNLAANDQFQGLSSPPGPEKPKPEPKPEPAKRDIISILHDIIGAIESVTGAFSLTYTNFDSSESYAKSSPVSKVANIETYWAQAKQDSRLLDPNVALGKPPRPTSTDPKPTTTTTTTTTNQ